MLKRLPAPSQIYPVFAVIATMFYGWSLVIFFWKLPSWLFFLHVGEIAQILAYQLTTNLAESIFILTILLAASLVLPARLFKDEFIVRGSTASLVLIGSMMLYLNRTTSTPVGSEYHIAWYLWMMVSALIAMPLSGLVTRFRPANNLMVWLSDHLIIFLFILMPLSLVSVLYVFVHALVM